MNRRNFLARALAIIAVGPLAKFAPVQEYAMNTTGMAIDKATFKFWRNQQTYGTDNSRCKTCGRWPMYPGYACCVKDEMT